MVVIPGWSCPRLLELYDEICTEKRSGVFVECGVAYGKSLAHLAAKADLSIEILAIDIHATFQGRNGLPKEEYRRMREYDSPLAAARANVQSAVSWDRFRRIEWIQARSEDVPQYLDFEVDFVFLDDHHEEESVYREIMAWLPKLKSGGVIAGHDINDHYPGVQRGLQRALTSSWRLAEYERGLDIRPPAPGENGWGGVWKFRKP